MNDPAEFFLNIDETSYIWYPFIKTMRNNKDTNNIHYKLGNDTRGSIGNSGISPLLEYVPETIYASDENTEYNIVNVNPYFRFESIFKDIISCEYDSNYNIICDIIMHILVKIDVLCGMSRRDFLVKIISDEIDNGDYGIEAVGLFNTVEKRILADSLIMFYNTADSLGCLRILFSSILTDFHVTVRDNEEFVFFNPYPFNERSNKKIQFIVKLFLPIGFPYVIHWLYSYGYVGYSECMNCEEFVL